MIKPGGVIIADNVLYKGYVMSDYNKHKQRTAVRNLREYIAEITNNKKLETEILEVGDGLAISKIKRWLLKSSFSLYKKVFITYLNNAHKMQEYQQ